MKTHSLSTEALVRLWSPFKAVEFRVACHELNIRRERLFELQS